MTAEDRKKGRLPFFLSMSMAVKVKLKLKLKMPLSMRMHMSMQLQMPMQMKALHTQCRLAWFWHMPTLCQFLFILILKAIIKHGGTGAPGTPKG